MFRVKSKSLLKCFQHRQGFLYNWLLLVILLWSLYTFFLLSMKGGWLENSIATATQKKNFFLDVDVDVAAPDVRVLSLLRRVLPLWFFIAFALWDEIACVSFTTSLESPFLANPPRKNTSVFKSLRNSLEMKKTRFPILGLKLL